MLRKCAEAMFGLGYKSLTEPIGGTVEVLGATYPRYRLVLIVVSVVVLGGLVLWYGRSRTGTRIKAMVGNPELARALGIPVRRYASATFVVGTCLAGLAGVMIAPLAPVQPFMGLDHILMSFFVLVVGGLGSVGGLLTGSAVIGGSNSIVSALSDSTGGYFSRAGAGDPLPLAAAARHPCAQLAPPSSRSCCCRSRSATSGPTSSACSTCTRSPRSASACAGAAPASCRSARAPSSASPPTSRGWR